MVLSCSGRLDGVNKLGPDPSRSAGRERVEWLALRGWGPTLPHLTWRGKTSRSWSCGRKSAKVLSPAICGG